MFKEKLEHQTINIVNIDIKTIQNKLIIIYRYFTTNNIFMVKHWRI